MNENENLVTEQVTQNAEQTATESPKMYTEAEFHTKLDEVLGKKIARREAKIRKEFERKYSDHEDLVGTLMAGTGKGDIKELNSAFKEYYGQKGINIPSKPEHSAKDIEVLARADAEDIIRAGFDEVVEELDRLTKLGADKMSAREKATFKVLAEHRHNAERANELSELGISEDVYNSKEFKDFQLKFTKDTPITDIYDIYEKTRPKKEFKTMGSMKNASAQDNGVKDYYSYEEAVKFTKSDFDKNPELMRAVERSMTQWK